MSDDLRGSRAVGPLGSVANALHCLSRASTLVDEGNVGGAQYQLSNVRSYLELIQREMEAANAECHSIPAKDGDVQVS